MPHFDNELSAKALILIARQKEANDELGSLGICRHASILEEFAFAEGSGFQSRPLLSGERDDEVAVVPFHSGTSRCCFHSEAEVARIGCVSAR